MDTRKVYIKFIDHAHQKKSHYFAVLLINQMTKIWEVLRLGKMAEI